MSGDDRRGSRRWRPGVRARLIVPILVFWTLALALATAAAGQVTRRALIDQAAERARAEARAVAHLATSSPGAERARVIGAYREAAGLQSASIERGARRSARVIGEASIEASWSGAPLGPGEVAVVRRPLAGVGAALGAARGYMLGALGLTGLLMGIALWALFTILILRPVRALRVASERAARGERARATRISAGGEFGELIDQFNRMLARLDDQRDELERRLGALERAQDSLIRSERLAAVGQLAAGLAHEIGNPLAAVAGFAEMVADGGLDAGESADAGRRIGRQVARIQATVRHLLDYARAPSEAPPARIDLRGPVAEAVALARAARRAQTIEFEPGPRPAWAEGVESEIVQIVLNLLLNAADAAGESGWARASIERAPDGAARVLVRDSGPGVMPHDADRLFDPFFTTKGAGAGTGLGLAISSRLAERHGATLRLVEGDDRTTFEVRFPPPGPPAPTNPNPL